MTSKICWAAIKAPYEPLSQKLAKEMVIQCEIWCCDDQIKEALWQDPANMDLAKTLISKRMGLRIALGGRPVKLKSPIAAIKAQGGDTIKLLATS